MKEAGEELDKVDFDLNLPRFTAWNWDESIAAATTADS